MEQMKKHTHGRFNFNLNRKVHKAFMNECIDNGTTMSPVIESFMVKYIDVSQKLKEKENKPEIANV